MAKPPSKPPRIRARKTDAPIARVASAAPKPADLRQAGLFDKPLPGWIKPCLPTLVDKPPEGPLWAHEIKWDGYRVSVDVADGAVTIRTRGGHDWTKRFPAIAGAAAGLKVGSAVIDGEAVILDADGRSSFAELQADLDHHGSERAVLYAFHLLFLDGEDLRGTTLENRRGALGDIIMPKTAIAFSEAFYSPGADLFRTACEHDLEGIVSKRLDRPYRSGRRRDWLKTKCVQSDTFVIIGFQPGSGAVRTPLTNIKVATFDGHALAPSGPASRRLSRRPCGRAWTGSSRRAARCAGSR